jgi:excisionase family DNA binding protein
MTDYLTTAEAAQRLGVSVPRIKQLIDRGTLHAMKIGRDWLIRPADLDTLPPRKIGRPPKPDAQPASVKRRGKPR